MPLRLSVHIFCREIGIACLLTFVSLALLTSSHATSRSRSRSAGDSLPASSSGAASLLPSAIRLDAIGERVLIPHAQSLNLKGPATIEMWVKPRQVANAKWHPNLIGKRQANRNLPSWCLGLGPKFELYTVADGCWLYSKRMLKRDEWSHVAVVFNGEFIRFFINGKPGSKHPAKSLGPANQDPVIIGTLLQNTQNFKGDIGPLRVSSKAMYSKSFQPQKFWNPDESTALLMDIDVKGTRVSDRSGNNNHGKTQGNVERLENMNNVPTRDQDE